MTRFGFIARVLSLTTVLAMGWRGTAVMRPEKGREGRKIEEMEHPQTPSSVDYDTFWKQDLQGRLKLFNAITPENRAKLVRAQIQRWMDINRARLTPEQVKMMEENLAFVTPDRYRLPMGPEDMARVKDLEARTAAVLSRRDMMQALTVYADYIPKKKLKRPLR